MKFRANKMLGLALGERSILIAEVTNAAGACQVVKTAEFVYPDGISQQQPEALGHALRHFIKEQGFSARSAVFGIAAKSVLTKSKEIPPVDPSLAADLLRLQVESEFSSELKDLVYDYAGYLQPVGANACASGGNPAKSGRSSRRYCPGSEAWLAGDHANFGRAHNGNNAKQQ